MTETQIDRRESIRKFLVGCARKAEQARQEGQEAISALKNTPDPPEFFKQVIDHMIHSSQSPDFSDDLLVLKGIILILKGNSPELIDTVLKSPSKYYFPVSNPQEIPGVNRI